MNLEHSLTPHTKINSKWIKDLSMRPDTIKLSEENIGQTLSDKAEQYHLRSTSQSNDNKKKNKQMGFKPKRFCTAKETLNKTERQPTEWEKIFANEATDKGLISKMHPLMAWTSTVSHLPLRSSGQNE